MTPPLDAMYDFAPSGKMTSASGQMNYSQGVGNYQAILLFSNVAILYPEE